MNISDFIEQNYDIVINDNKFLNQDSGINKGFNGTLKSSKSSSSANPDISLANSDFNGDVKISAENSGIKSANQTNKSKKTLLLNESLLIFVKNNGNLSFEEFQLKILEREGYYYECNTALILSSINDSMIVNIIKDSGNMIESLLYGNESFNIENNDIILMYERTSVN